MSPLLKQKNKSPESSRLMKYCLISGAIAAAIMLFILAVHENTLLGGKQTVLRMDLYHQYGPLFAELYDRIVNRYSMVYSWTSGLGGAFLGNFFNYCCSPFALIILLCGHKNMPEAIALMFLLKAVFASMSFTYYINKSNKSVRKESIAFGLLYAFCAYFVAYSWNIMWIDAMAAFPIVILGIEYIIQKRKPAVYMAAMTYTMITNYYMAYMVCILSVIYFLYYYFSRYELRTQFRTKKESAPVSADEAEQFAELINNTDGVDAEITVVPTNENDSYGEQTVLCEQTAENNIYVEPLEPAVYYDTAENSDAPLTVPEEPAEEMVVNGCSLPVHEPAVVSEEKPLTRRQKRKLYKKSHSLFSSRFFKTGLTFAIASFICFFIAAFALLPVAYCLNTSSATGGTFPKDLKIYFNLFDFFVNHLPGLETTIRSSGDIVLPNVFCGTLTLLLCPLYFFSNRVSGRKKIIFASVLVLFYLSFSMNNFNFVWHGLHMPNDLPFRYSFGYSFLLLTVAYHVFLNIDEFDKKVYIGEGFALILFIAIAQKVGSQHINNMGIVTALGFVIIYVILIGSLISKKFRKGSITTVMIIATAVELCFGDSPNFIMQQPKDAYVGDYDSYQQISKLTEKEENEIFYRTELTKLRARMDPCWYGYNGVSTFSSMAYEPVAKLMNKMGLFSNDINSYTYYPQTPIFNSMFSLKYLYDKDSLISSSDYYSFITSDETFRAYEYNFFLPIGMAVNGTMEDFEGVSSDPFEVQNEFMEKATGVSDVLAVVGADSFETNNVSAVSADTINSGLNFAFSKTDKSTDGVGTVIIDVKEAGNYYVYCGSTKVSTVAVTADNYSYSYSSSAIQPFMLDVGYQKEGAQIKVAYTLSDNDNATVAFTAARLDSEKFRKAYDNICDNGLLELDKMDGPEFSGRINVNGDGRILYMSIPYDESWVISIDGARLSYKNENIVKIGDALIGVKLSEGEHTVDMKYNPRGLSTGIKLTALGIAAVAFLLVFKFIIADKLPAKLKKYVDDYYPEDCID